MLFKQRDKRLVSQRDKGKICKYYILWNQFINVIAMLMSLIKYLNIIWGSGSSMKAISLNPRTDKGGGGDGCHPRNKVLSKF